MEEDTRSPLEVADTERAEEGDRGSDDGWEGEVGPEPALVRAQVQTRVRRDVDDGLVDVVVGDNVQAVEVGSDHIRWVESSRMEGGRSCYIGNAEVEVRMKQVDRVVGCDNDVKGVAAGVQVQCVRTSNCHDGRIEYCQGTLGSGKSGKPAAVAGVVGSGPVGSFLQEEAEQQALVLGG